MAERRRAKLTHMASILLDDPAEPVPASRTPAISPSQAFLGSKPEEGGEVAARAATVRIDDAEGDDEEEEVDRSAFDYLSTNGRLAHGINRLFAGSPTPAYMMCFLFTVIILILIENITTGTLSSIVAFAVFIGCNIGFLLVIMTARAVWSQFLGMLYAENRVAPALNNLLDPDLPILIWALTMHLFWSAQITQVFDRTGNKSGYHRIKFIPRSWEFQYIPDRDATYLRLALIVLVFWAIRDLVVELIMFRILLGFLTNFQDSVVLYLKNYALLRKLNANWVKLIPFQPTSMGPFGGGGTPCAPPVAGRISKRQSQAISEVVGQAVQRHVASKRGEMGLTPSFVSPPPAPTPSSRFQRLAQKYLIRPGQNRRRERNYHVQFTGREAPSVLQRKNIKAVEESGLANLLSITWIQSNPTILFVRGERCEMKSKKVAKAVARMLFQELINFRDSVESVARDIQTRELEAVEAFGGLEPSAESPRGASEEGAGGGETLSPSGRLKPGVSKVGAKPYRISVQQPDAGQFRKKLGDRLAAELGTRNEEARGNDTDEGLTPSGSEESEQEQIIPPMTSDLRKNMAERPAGRARLAPGGAQEPQVFSDPAIDTVVTGAGGPFPARVRARDRFSTLPATRIPPAQLQQLNQAAMNGDYTQLESVASRDTASPTVPTLAARFERGNARHGTPKLGSVSSEADSLEPFAETEAPMMNVDAAEKRTAPGTRLELPKSDAENRIQQRISEGYRALISAGERKQLTEEELKEITKAEIKAVKLVAPKDKGALTSDFFALFMNAREIPDLMDLLDPAHLGRVTEKMFVKGVLSVHQARRQMCTSLDAQKEIERVFHRVATFFLTFLMVLAFLFIIGIGANTIILTGAAALSASGVVLSFVYTDFILSIILIVFLNPYSIGDGLMIDNEFMTVSRITTYFSEFVSGEGKIYYYSHRELTNKKIVNQSRSKNASFSLIIRVGDHMTAAQYRAFKRVINAYLTARPMEFKPPLFIHWLGFAPNHYVEIHMMAMHTEGWQSPSIWDSKSYWMAFVLRQCHLMGLTYKKPMLPVEITGGSRLIDTASHEQHLEGSSVASKPHTEVLPGSPNVPKKMGKHTDFMDLTTPQGLQAASRFAAGPAPSV